jgi:hypothetical protein
MVGGEFAEAFEVAEASSSIDGRVLAWFSPCLTTSANRRRT